MTYTLVFRVTREVWDALERGEKTVEYRDDAPYWYARLKGWPMRGPGPAEAVFLCGRRTARYTVCTYPGAVARIPLSAVPERRRSYLTTPEVWAVELGRRIEP